NGATEIGAGESGWFSDQRETPPSEPRAPAATASAAPQPAADSGTPNARAVREREKSTTPRVNAQGWRQHAEQGEFGRAYALLDTTRVTDDVEELLLAADAARLSGH